MDMFIVAKGVIMNLDRMPPEDLLTIGIHSPGKVGLRHKYNHTRAGKKYN
jgi:hypothetical protein